MRHCTLVTLAALCVAFTAAAATASKVTLDYPRGGEVFIIGTKQQIRLGAKTRVSPVTLELSRDGGKTFETLATVTINRTEATALGFVLTFDVAGPASAGCIMRATGNTGKTTYKAQSAPFAIVQAYEGGWLGAGAGTGAPPEIADGSVTTPKIADGAVTNGKLANRAVSAAKISSGAASPGMVLTADGDGGADFARYANTAVEPGAGNSIVAALNDPATTAKIDGAVLSGTAAINITGNAATATTAAGVADFAVSTTKIVDGAVTAAKVASFPKARVTNSAAISLPSGAFTPLSFDTEIFDTDNCHDNAANPSRLTCNSAGVYLISASVSIEPNNTGTRHFWLRLNGTTAIASQLPNATLNGDTHITISTIHQLDAGDYVEAMVGQSSGVALDARASTDWTPIFAMAKLP